MSAQNLRVAYSFYYKTDPTQNKYQVEPDMMLDWSIEKSVFYNDATFHRDSLSSGVLRDSVYSQSVVIC